MSRGRTGLTLVILASALAITGGCKDQTKTSTDTGETGAEPVFRRYTVRAQVERLPQGDQRLRLHHEAIPAFDGGDAYGWGMNVMSMDFWPPVGNLETAPDPSRIPETLDLEGIDVGDIVSVTFEVQHASAGADPGAYYAIGIEELPADTPLDFETQLPKSMTFETRGEVVTLPGPTTDFKVRHEVVPDFPNPDGTQGMNTMVMPFWPPSTSAGFAVHQERVPEDLDLAGIEVGDKVLITWEYQRDRASNKPIAWYAVRVEPLPGDTALDFTPLQR